MTVGSDVNWSEVYGALADDGRRETIRLLIGNAGETTFDDLARHLLAVAFAGRDVTAGTVEPGELQLARIETALRHVHLPKLADAGLIRWNAEAETVELSTFGRWLPVGFVNDPVVTGGRRAAADRAHD